MLGEFLLITQFSYLNSETREKLILSNTSKTFVLTQIVRKRHVLKETVVGEGVGVVMRSPPSNNTSTYTNLDIDFLATVVNSSETVVSSLCN